MLPVRAAAIAGKILYGVLCLAAGAILVVAGVARNEVSLVHQSAKGVALPGGKTVGAINILVMGLESRTNYEGQVLPNSLLTAMHAGKASSVAAGQLGSQDTNTLILIHIFAGGKKAVGFSIPRDSVVTFPQTYLGYSSGKIDAAYAWAYNQYLNKHTGSESRTDLYLHANQAGQSATVDTVESLTGVQIDHFAEVNLAGFYYLAQAFKGIEVCVKPAPRQGGLPAGANLTDHDPLTGSDNSGFSAYLDGYNRKKGGAQYLHLSAPQALAFVRSRDTLPGTDVGRTYRQQATIDYVVWKLKNEGVFSDAGMLNSLLGTANQYLITDSTFNLLDFATDMQALNGENLHFTTLPGTQENDVTLPGYPTPQSVIQVDVPAIQKLVKGAFTDAAASGGTGKKSGGSAKTSAPAPPPSTVTVDVYNGDPGAPGLASRVSEALVGLGYNKGTVGNPSAQSKPVESGTQVFYGAGASANAAKIAVQFGATPVALTSLPAGHVEVLIGSTVTTVPASLSTSSTASTSSTSSTSTPSTTAPTAGSGSSAPDPAMGDSSVVKKSAPFGVPCVY